ncbi:endocuticle structural protein SgAbd-6 [Drosophila novamexicana]|uniref:endocuticle structural protein SgAbd-6 n=1 Tax=Drosophila novamexicana TaxID=47314 RepID=UPI0011E5CCBC|nr:endocuticle structural protein SgAbd-6 [Drosophila novamexicana]XP_030560880.1 endocuticle structural protein SgAbd-6 [Drosophila novamexicana]XP_030560881.1 endocuticle structural protein SgAbd-6 [Drosophila novamexicana]
MITPKILGLLGLLAALAIARVNASPNDAQILKFENVNLDGNGYAFYYETSDGISRQETAQLKHAGTAEEAIAVQGSVKWVGPDGVHYKLNYLADENGFQPEGEHLPRQETSGML